MIYIKISFISFLLCINHKYCNFFKCLQIRFSLLATNNATIIKIMLYQYHTREIPFLIVFLHCRESQHFSLKSVIIIVTNKIFLKNFTKFGQGKEQLVAIIGTTKKPLKTKMKLNTNSSKNKELSR